MSGAGSGGRRRRARRPNWGVGIGIGVGIGVAMGVALDQIWVGMAIGIALATAFALVFATPRDSDDGSPSPPARDWAHCCRDARQLSNCSGIACVANDRCADHWLQDFGAALSSGALTDYAQGLTSSRNMSATSHRGRRTAMTRAGSTAAVPQREQWTGRFRFHHLGHRLRRRPGKHLALPRCRVRVGRRCLPHPVSRRARHSGNPDPVPRLRDRSPVPRFGSAGAQAPRRQAGGGARLVPGGDLRLHRGLLHGGARVVVELLRVLVGSALGRRHRGVLRR